MRGQSPYFIVDEFEKRISEWCGAPYGVSVESCTMALFLCLQYVGVKEKEVIIPSRTYVGVPCRVIHAGGRVKFDDSAWEGEYELKPHNIWDAALRFKKNMYHGGFQCLSFHSKKLLPIGRGGMILTDSEEAMRWFRRARFDGRNPVPLQEDHFDMLGWNCYMTAEQAARGIDIFEVMRRSGKEPNDLSVDEQKYPYLPNFTIYQQ
jgi:dTDP-4-amino-4,6-dideoxygalactose transaminase